MTRTRSPASLETATLTQLVLEHADLARWLNLPSAELWAEQHAEKTQRITDVWQTICRRFPEYAARQCPAAIDEAIANRRKRAA